MVPSGQPVLSCSSTSPPLILKLLPIGLFASFVSTSTLATAATEARASPRKPKVKILSRSSAVFTLLVAWRRKAVGISSWAIPQPLSVTRIKLLPPSLISTVIWLAPASIAFSTSSFITEAGRSITSPAAISSKTLLSRRFIFAKALTSIIQAFF